jgi:ribonuclease D
MTLQLATAATLNDAAKAITDAPWIAIDTEFHAERRYVPRLYLVQVHIEGGPTWIFDPTLPETLEVVGEALASTPWVLHAGRQDLRILNRALGTVPEQVFDAQIASGLLGPNFPEGYGKLTAKWIDVEVDKSATLSDWSRRPLLPAQLTYAADDVRLLPQLRAALLRALAQRGRTAIANQAFSDARSAAIAPVDPDAKWTSMRAAGVADGPGRAVMQCLASWREETAWRRDQPVGSILSDGLLVGLGRRKPTTVDALFENRRFPKGVAKRYGPELVAAIREGLQRPEHQWPQVIAPRSAEARRMDLLRAFGDALAQRDQWGRELVWPDGLIRRMALTQTPDETMALLTGWRAELTGAPLKAFLAGDLTLSMGPNDVEIGRRTT